MRLILGLVCLFATPAVAQPAAATPTRQALAEELAITSGAGDLMDTMLVGTIDTLMPVMLRGNEARADEVRVILREEFAKSFAKRRGDMIAIGRDGWSNNFTEAELRDLIAFYRSGTGRKLVGMQSAMAKTAMAAGQEVGRAAAVEALPRIIDRMKAARLSVPERT